MLPVVVYFYYLFFVDEPCFHIGYILPMLCASWCVFIAMYHIYVALRNRYYDKRRKQFNKELKMAITADITNINARL